ncbi:lipoyl(octanoyl) transferase LipB [Streptomyces sp. NBC_00199]|uniref:lipoyl(octanoyl) transferase LipB n=1 Tax=Streptomyces sp. NBC_00199 TaxID=2975678 RepID=UPI00224D2BA2|nr:lipoyl(octanoyl) transferase LipB [Streptomyces sp. NBC_00199]MCX5265804.1 lipoyl(octanoyl) transferase LipB [Streptomyces sp. NBC_00199]
MGSGTLERIDLGEVPYAEAMADMSRWVHQRREGAIPDRLVLLRHPPVITYGSRTERHHLPADTSIPVVEVDRGGQATYHGPGQLIGYLVIDLRERGPGDIVRWLEHGLVQALHVLGFPALRRDTPRGAQSLVGVWTPDHQKIASIGMRIRGSVTSHGFALNITPDMQVFSRFTACGLPEVQMTSLAEMAADLNVSVPTEEAVRTAVAAALGAEK